MAVVEFMNNPYNGQESIENLVYYVTHDKLGRWLHYCGGKNVYLPQAAQQIRAVKEYFRKDEGFRLMRHIVISFDNREPIYDDDAYAIADMACNYYAGKYQLVYGIHNDTDNLHIHIAFSTTNFINGKLYSDNGEDFFKFRNYVFTLVKNYINTL